VLFTFLLLLFANGRYLGALVYGLAIIIFMYALSLLSYMPAVDIPAQAKKRGLNPL
jgi:uncharacterized protein YebE (UPF0316 family)